MVYFMEIQYISVFLKNTPYSNIRKLNESKTVVTSIIHKKIFKYDPSYQQKRIAQILPHIHLAQL